VRKDFRREYLATDDQRQPASLSGVQRAEFFADSEIIPAETVPHCRAENLAFGDVVHVDRNAEHGIDGNHVGANQAE